MALEARVTLHENPFENLVVWEKRSPISSSKHRDRTCGSLQTIDTIVIKDDNDKDEYHTDYCVLAAAAKDPSSQHGRSRPVLLSDRDSPRRQYTTGYNTFARTHITGPLYEQRSVQPTTQRHTTVTPSYGSEINKYNDEDVQIFCCNRDVECIIDYATCMCCVKGAIYHCTKDSYDEGNMAKDPCTCEQDPSTRACVSRWACMALCSLFLPCVLCYLPARGCVQVCTCYKQHRTAKRQRGRTKDRH